jgi:hypothetical protein
VPGDIFGLPLVDESRWRAHNPVDLAANLRGVEIQLRTGRDDLAATLPGITAFFARAPALPHAA